MSRIYRKSMYVYFSFPSVHRRRRRIFISTLISHQPTVPPDCLCSCPHRYDIKIITLALTPTLSDSTTLIFMFVPCISSNVSQKCIQKSIRAFSQMQKRAKSVSRLTINTNTPWVDDVFRIIFAHNCSSIRALPRASACNRRFWGVHHTPPLSRVVFTTHGDDDDSTQNALLLLLLQKSGTHLQTTTTTTTTY